MATLTRQSFLQPSRWGFCQLLVSGAALCKTGIEVGGPCSFRHKTLPLENETKHPNKLHGLAQKALVASAVLSVTFLSIFPGLFHICHQRWALVYDTFLCLTLVCFEDPQLEMTVAYLAQSFRFHSYRHCTNYSVAA